MSDVESLASSGSSSSHMRSHGGKSSQGSTSSQPRSKGRSSERPSKRRETGYVIEVVYDDPNDLLQEAPRNRTRRLGDTTGEILFYGDDLMFGCHSATPYPEMLRDRLLKCGLRLVVNALPKRALSVNDVEAASVLVDPADQSAVALGEWFNGTYHFGPVFSSHSASHVVFGLGTNDLKAHLRKIPELLDAKVTAEYIVDQLVLLIEHARTLMTGHCHDGKLKIIVIVPPPLVLTRMTSELGFDQTAVDISAQFSKAAARLAVENDAILVNITHCASSWTNGLCPSTMAQASQLAEAVWLQIESWLPRPISTRSSAKTVA